MAILIAYSYKRNILYLNLIILTYLVYVSINFLISPFSTTFVLMFLQAIVNLKLFIISLALLLICYHKKDSIKWCRKILLFTSIAFILSLLLNLIFGQEWNLYWNPDISPWALYRDGDIRPIAHFSQGAHVGYFVAFTFIAILLTKFRTFLIRNFLSSFLISFLIVIFLADFLTYRKIILIFFAFILPVSRLFNNYSKVFFFSSCTIILFVLIIVYNQFSLTIFSETITSVSSYFSNDHLYIRGKIFYNGLILAFENFPFGSSPATYGTVFSIIGESQVYNYLNLTYWASSDKGIYDCILGSLIGELGFIGIILFGIFITFYKQLIIDYVPIKGQLLFFTIFFYALLTMFIGPFVQSGFGSALFGLVMIYAYEYYEKEI